MDLILGTAPPSPATASAAAGPSTPDSTRSRSVPARLDCLASPSLRSSRSRGTLAAPAAAAPAPVENAAQGERGSPGSSLHGGSSQPELCAICMDAPVRVAVSGCSHNLCFCCARRLCTAPDRSVPQCPFCRQVCEWVWVGV